MMMKLDHVWCNTQNFGLFSKVRNLDWSDPACFMRYKEEPLFRARSLRLTNAVQDDLVCPDQRLAHVIYCGTTLDDTLQSLV